MKKFYPLFLFLLFLGQVAQAEVFRGYIITLSGIRLTGQIGSVVHSDLGSEMVFINDFGTIYNIHPALIQGFVYEMGNKKIIFESRFSNRKWMFLRVLYKGEGINLYQSPEEKLRLTAFGDNYGTTLHFEEYWLEVAGRKTLIPLTRGGFKRKIRKILERSAPGLAEKIGQQGYRWKDLVKIIEEFNEIQSMRIWKS